MIETDNSFTRQISKAVRKHIDDIIEDEAKKAKENIEQRVKNMSDRIALNILDRYDVEMNRKEIIIKVNKNDS